MKKIKKIFAIVLAMAMVLGMSVTVFAASPQASAVAANGSITVRGLAQENTTVTIYNVVEPDANGNAWKVQDWAKDVTGAIDEEADPYTIDASKLAAEVAADTENSISDSGEKTTNNGMIEFSDLEAGVYLVIAKSTSEGSLVTYSPMLAVTYEYDENGYLVAGEANVVAKSETIKIEKSADANDTYVAVGTDVGFTVSTLFPSFYNADGSDATGTYKITDRPTNLDIKKNTVVVKVGNSPLSGADVTVEVDENGIMTIEFTSNYIGTSNEHAGKKVEITYTAEVTAANSIKNTVEANVDEDTTVTESEAKLFTGSITIRKTNEEGTLPLADAEFIVYTTRDNETQYAIIDTIRGEETVVGWTTDEDKAKEHTIKTGASGTVAVYGLDADEIYNFKEVVAPAGYSINTVDAVASWTPLVSGVQPTDRVGTATMTDTTLSALPSTGGIGTTIFTICGCAIIVVAAGLFFASRRKRSA